MGIKGKRPSREQERKRDEISAEYIEALCDERQSLSAGLVHLYRKGAGSLAICKRVEQHVKTLDRLFLECTEKRAEVFDG